MTSKFVHGLDAKQDINRAIAIPDELYDSDGRRFQVRSWRPTVDIDSCVEVTIEATVQIPEEPSEAQEAGQ